VFSEVAAEVAALARTAALDAATTHTVDSVLRAVQAEGLPAALRYSFEFDHVQLTAENVMVPEASLHAALAALRVEKPTLVAALETMIERVRLFAEAERAALGDVRVGLPDGGYVGQRWLPVGTVGVYVPGGRAFYPSSLAMAVVPAQVAGVGRIVCVTPPSVVGPAPAVLATAALLGIHELYTLGGAQGIAFLAYCEPAADVIAGPGNRFVAEAKRRLLGTCGIDSVAGPTEVLILADDSADPALVAEDLLAQAEHDPDAAAVVIADDAGWLARVADQLVQRVAASPRRAILEASLGAHGRLYCAPRAVAIAFAERWAPEHLELAVRDPQTWISELTTAAALFLGHASAEAFGDYGVGPNHVLPTGRSARFSSPLGVATYMKRQSLLALSGADARAMAPWVAEIADAEQLVHHAASARLRATQGEP
jgi:histidinol dehydrogenase